MDSQKLVDHFEEAVSSTNKLFIPENIDKRLAGNILRFVEDQGQDSTALLQCIDYYLLTTNKNVVGLKDFANEIDMVINIGALKSGDWDTVKRDIEGVTNAARGRALVKVILETSLLNDEEKIKACESIADCHRLKHEKFGVALSKQQREDENIPTTPLTLKMDF